MKEQITPTNFFYLIFSLSILLSSCAGMMNHNKPDLRDDAAIKSAEKLGLVAKDNGYLIRDGLLILIPIAGFIAAPIGLISDITDNNHYVVTDKKKYEIWKDNYIKKIEKENNDTMK